MYTTPPLQPNLDDSFLCRRDEDRTAFLLPSSKSDPNISCFTTKLQMNEARLSHLPFGVPVRAFFLLIQRPSGSPE